MSPRAQPCSPSARCSLGAGLGYGASNLGGSGHAAAATAARAGHDGEHGTRSRRERASPPASRTRRSAATSARFRAIVDAQNPGVALDDLDALYKSDAYVKRTCHPLAHEIGHLAYAKYKSVTAAEEYARETCWSGYHHGLMESYISQFDDKQLRTKMNGICKQDRDPPVLARLLQLLARPRPRAHDPLHAGHLPRAALLQRDHASWERQSCYSGVFMQNIVANGSGMHRSVDLKPSDPIYPCDAVKEQEKPSCYLMQTSYVLQVKNWNLPVAFRICDRVEARYVGTCYRSMGRDISGAALLDPGTVVAQCGMGAAAHRAECIAGAAANAVYDRHGARMADALCRLVRAGRRAGLPSRPPNDAVATL